MVSKQKEYAGEHQCPTDNTLHFSSYRFSREAPVISTNFFSIQVPNPAAAHLPDASSYRKEYLGAYEQTRNFLETHHMRAHNIPREDSSGIADYLMEGLSMLKVGDTARLAYPKHDFTIISRILSDLHVMPTLTLYEATWIHLTVWDENIFLKAGKVDIDQFLFCSDSQYYHCISPCFYDLKYSADGKKWDSIGKSFYGTAGTISGSQVKLASKKRNYGKNKHEGQIRTENCIKSLLYFPIGFYPDSEQGMAAMNDPYSIDFTCVIDEIFGPQSVSWE